VAYAAGARIRRFNRRLHDITIVDYTGARVRSSAVISRWGLDHIAGRDLFLGSFEPRFLHVVLEVGLRRTAGRNRRFSLNVVHNELLSMKARV
jgi:hypothetical protein